jgi:hydrogenase expression/formation protein HypC
MCLAIPMKVIEIVDEDGLKVARAEAGGTVIEVDVSLIDKVSPGDYVIVHAGIAISKLNPEEAEEIIRTFQEVYSAINERPK